MDLMEQIQSGMFDDIINATIQERDEKMAMAGSPDFLDWLYDSVSKQGTISDENIDELNSKDRENIKLLQYLKSYLIEYYGAKTKDKNDDYGFACDSLTFGYRRKCFKLTTITGDTTITEVTMLDRKPKDCINIDY